MENAHSKKKRKEKRKERKRQRKTHGESEDILGSWDVRSSRKEKNEANYWISNSRRVISHQSSLRSPS